MRKQITYLNTASVGIVLAVYFAQTASAIVYMDGRRLIQASSEATGSGEDHFDNPPAIEVFGTDPVFDEITTAAIGNSGASASASSSQFSELGPDRIEANGSYTVDAIASEGYRGYAQADNEFRVSFLEVTGTQPTFTLTGTLENFDAAGSTAVVSFSGPGVSESVLAQDESQSFSFSGVLGTTGEYELIVELQGQSLAQPLPPPLGGDPAQSSSGSFDLVLPEPGIPFALACGTALLAILGRKRIRG